MRFFIKELLFFCIERFFLKASRQLARISSAQKILFCSKVLPVSNIGNIEIGQILLRKVNLFGNVLLDVKTDNPWRILPFSDEVEVGIDGFSWLNDLAIINNQSSRDLSESWIDLFPLNRLNINTHSSYEDFRLARAKLRDLGEPLDSMILSGYLDKYAETGNEYVKVLQKIIKQNNLKDFDEAKLLPSSIELESLI